MAVQPGKYGFFRLDYFILLFILFVCLALFHPLVCTSLIYFSATWPPSMIVPLLIFVTQPEQHQQVFYLFDRKTSSIEYSIQVAGVFIIIIVLFCCWFFCLFTSFDNWIVYTPRHVIDFCFGRYFHFDI